MGVVRGRRRRSASSAKAKKVELAPAAGGAGNDFRAAVAQVQSPQDLITHLYLFHRIAGQRHPDGVADAFGQEPTDAQGRLDDAGIQAPGLRDAHMEGVVHLGGQQAISGHGVQNT